ncbi:MAG: alpha-galactosidase [Lewinella sp.]|nr:alpha-galactosidase [Lewinella sp.]
MKTALNILLYLILTGWADGQPADWLLTKGRYPARVEKSEDGRSVTLTNGLIARRFLLSPNVATTAFDNLMTGESLIRGVKPEAEVVINGDTIQVGGLAGQPNYAFFRPEWEHDLSAVPGSMTLRDYNYSDKIPAVEWKSPRHHAPDASWPPRGIHLQFRYAHEAGLEVVVHYILYDGIPVMAKWLTVKNLQATPIRVDRFVSEQLAAIEYASWVEGKGVPYPTPHLHVETDYAFNGMASGPANRWAVHWEPDPDYSSQVHYERKTPCLLKVYPEIGPGADLGQGEELTTFTTYVMAYDSYDRERMGLAQRRFYRTVAPWTTENPLMMHVRYADWETVRNAIDQCAEVGFEMVILTFGSGFNIEDERPEYLAEMKKYADYARSKGVEIGGYSLLASRKIGDGQDVELPEGMTPTFGNSPCLQSEWGRDYFRKLYNFYEKTGFSLLEHDGSYPGDPCLSTHHPGHKGWADSRWRQYELIRDFYRWCRKTGVYLNVPDYYYLAGANKCAMGYREVNWSLPRDQQVIHTRQNIFDGAWEKAPSMGWMFVPLTEYHGGGEAATIEPLSEHLDHYRQMLFCNLSGGVQACYRGPRLYDTDATREMVKEQVSWFKAHREVLEGDILHLRRPDGRDIDYWLNVNPNGKEKGLLAVFNPLPTPVRKRISVPLYYTGLTDAARITGADGQAATYTLDREYRVELEVEVAGHGFGWWVVEGEG